MFCPFPTYKAGSTFLTIFFIYDSFVAKTVPKAISLYQLNIVIQIMVNFHLRIMVNNGNTYNGKLSVANFGDFGDIFY